MKFQHTLQEGNQCADFSAKRDLLNLTLKIVSSPPMEVEYATAMLAYALRISIPRE